MDTLELVIIIVVVVLLLLAFGGFLASRRRRADSADRFRVDIERANRELAAAHASDRGWEPTTVRSAAEQAFAERHPGVEPTAIELVQVIDPPGTDDDKAVFRVETADGIHQVTLGRRSGQWIAEAVD